jgi:hypothetical protein
MQGQCHSDVVAEGSLSGPQTGSVRFLRRRERGAQPLRASLIIPTRD